MDQHLTKLQIWWMSRSNPFLSKEGTREYFGLHQDHWRDTKGRLNKQEPFTHPQTNMIYKNWNDLIRRRLIKKIPLFKYSWQMTKRGFDLLGDVFLSRQKTITFKEYQKSMDDLIDDRKRLNKSIRNFEIPSEF